MTKVYLIIWLHFICDFILQTDDMAKGKSSSNSWLTKHILTYSVSMLFVLLFLFNPEKAVPYVFVNGAAHFLTDYVTSRMTKKLWQQQRVHDFFVVIGMDQAIHMTTLIVTLPLLG